MARIGFGSPHLASALPRLSFASASARLCVFSGLGLRRPTLESEKTSSRAPPLLSLHTKQESLSRLEGEALKQKKRRRKKKKGKRKKKRKRRRER